MFDYEQTGGSSDSWVVRWREWRGIDKWPCVKATVLRNVTVSTGDGQYHKLELTYNFTTPGSSEDVLVVAWLTASPGTKPAVATQGDVVEILVNPDRPDKPIFRDTANSAQNLVFGLLLVTVVIGLSLARGCSH